MIKLTRLNGSSFVLNSDLIQSAERAPDTVVTLLHGERLIVLESESQIVDRVVRFRARTLATAVRFLDGRDRSAD